MSYSNQEVEELFQELLSYSRNILIGTTSGGTVGETVFVTLKTPFQGQIHLKGITIQECPPGECLALSDGVNWYVVGNNSTTINETLIRYRRYREVKESQKQEKMTILYTSRNNETHECTCPKFSESDGKCKEDCVKGDYSSLKECQSKSQFWTVYMSAGVDHWHRVKYVSRYYPGVEATFDIYPDNRLNEPGFGSIIYDIPYTKIINPPSDNAGAFLSKLTDADPDFLVSCTFVGSLKWYGEKDLEAVNYSSYIYMWRKDSRDYKDTEDPYSLYKKLINLYVLGPYAYRYYNNIDREYPRGYYEGQLNSFADEGYNTPFIGMMMSVEPKNIAKGLDFFNTTLGSRLGGQSLRIDYVLDKRRNLIKDYNSPPPPPPYEPPNPGKLYFVLGGDKSKPLKLPFELSAQDPYTAFLSVVQGKKIVTIKHGKEKDKQNEDTWCKITTLVVEGKNKVKKTTTSAPGPVPPILKEWRSHLIYDFKPQMQQIENLKCSYHLWNSQIANIASNLKVYPWDGVKAQLYEFNSIDLGVKDFFPKILEKNLHVPSATISTQWKLDTSLCDTKKKVSINALKVFRLLTHDNQVCSPGSNLIQILAFAIYRSK